jgi:hypothetical protein
MTDIIAANPGTNDATAVQHTDTLDHILIHIVHEHPFTISGGGLIIGITILKILNKLRGK